MILAELAARLEREGSLTLTLKVTPKSARNEIAGVLADGTVKLKIVAAPEKGKANMAICAFLAELFRVAQRDVEIVRGATSSTKVVAIRRR